MSNSTSIVTKGRLCIEAAKTALNLIDTQSGAEEAAKRLSSLHDYGKELQTSAEENRKKLLDEEKQLNVEMDHLRSLKHHCDSTISRLNSKKCSLESELSRQRTALLQTQDELSSAQARIHYAKEDLRMKELKSTAVGVVLGAVSFSIIGAAEMGAELGAKAAALYNKDMVEKAERDIRQKISDIERIERETNASYQSLSGMHDQITGCMQRITDNERKMKDVHNQISRVKNSIAFQKKAVEFWSLFTQDAERGTERTQRLKMIVSKASEKNNLKILKSNGTITIAKTFIEAWEEISDKQGQIMYV